MSRFNYESKDEPKKLSEHPHFKDNVWRSKELIKNTLGKLPKGMKVYGKEALLYICWIAPRHENCSTFIRPIFLHQSSSDFSKEVEFTLNLTITLANEKIATFTNQLEVDLDNMFTNDLDAAKNASKKAFGMNRWVDDLNRNFSDLDAS